MIHAHRYVCIALLLAGVAAARSTETKANTIDEQSGRSSNGIFGELRYVYQMYKDCSGAELSSCLKLRLLTAMDRVARSAQLNIAEGVTVVKDENTLEKEETPKTPQEIEANLPRSLEDKEDALNTMIFDKFLRFFQSHTLKLKLPNVEELSRSLQEEGNNNLC